MHTAKVMPKGLDASDAIEAAREGDLETLASMLNTHGAHIMNLRDADGCALPRAVEAATPHSFASLCLMSMSLPSYRDPCTGVMPQRES